jgi:hypothetical protein
MIDIVTREITVVSEANRRDHWAQKSRRTKSQRHAAYALCIGPLKEFEIVWPVVVTLTRLGHRNLDDDNLAGAFKAVRDGIADALGKDDGSRFIQWHYTQARGDAGIRIQIAPGVFTSVADIAVNPNIVQPVARRGRSLKGGGAK